MRNHLLLRNHSLLRKCAFASMLYAQHVVSAARCTGNTPVNDLTAVGEGRGTVLSLKLDRMADSISGQTVVDPKGYLTGARLCQLLCTAQPRCSCRTQCLFAAAFDILSRPDAPCRPEEHED